MYTKECKTSEEAIALAKKKTKSVGETYYAISSSVGQTEPYYVVEDGIPLIRSSERILWPNEESED